MHLPWLGEQAVLRRSLRDGLGVGAPATVASTPVLAGDDDLSDREREVLKLVADGLTDAAIAERLVLSPHTIHRHVANIRLKLGQPSRGAAAADAVRRGLI